jgi:hypothetical protein
VEKIARATLRYLFHQYLKGPSVLYSINQITDQFKADPIKVSHYLQEQKWIRERWVHQNNTVTCRITVSGIEEINPAFITQKLKQLIGGLMHAGGQKSLQDMFENRIGEYAIALDFVNQLDKMGLIHIVHHMGDINVELTAFGYHYFEKRGKFLLPLMSVTA